MTEAGPFGTAVRELRCAAGLSQAAIAHKAHISKSYVGLLEQGIRPPTKAAADALDCALNARGLLSALAREDDDMKRRNLLAAITALAAGTGELDRMLHGLNHTGGIARVGMSDVAMIENSVAFATRLDLQHGGTAAVGPGRALLSWALQQLDGQMSDSVRAELMTATSTLASRVAYSSYDAGLDTQASDIYGIALKAAREGTDPNLVADVMLRQSIHLAHNRDYGAAVDVSHGAGELPGLLPAVRANVGLIHARHLAQMGARQLSREETSRALDLFSSGDIGDVPKWSKFVLVGPASLLNVAAQSQLFAGDYAAAVPGFTAGLERPDGVPGARGRAYALAQLALAYLRSGDLDCAESTATTFLDTTAGGDVGLKSVRVADHTNALARELSHAGRRELAHELADRAKELQPTVL
jgi:transcriptional regulator with XRE-family HTH domain